ncbi:MAG: class I SAM-dependent methyltransferase [Cyanobium sp.]
MLINLGRSVRAFVQCHTYPLRYGAMGSAIATSYRIPGWMRGAEAVALARICRGLPKGAVIVEIGCFLGSATALLAGMLRLNDDREGRVHCVDPFDASGDAFSVPVYRSMADSLPNTLRECFDQNLSAAGLDPWVEVHPGLDHEVARRWSRPLDLLFLDGDQSPAGADLAFSAWVPFLKPGGIIAVHNSGPRRYAAGHDGSRRLVEREFKPPGFTEVSLVGSTTFARKVVG